MNVEVSPQAILDLDDIWAYIAQDNKVAADKVVSLIKHKMTSLGEFPYIGKPREYLLANLRMLVQNNYLIFYQVNESVQILRVLHHARDLSELIK